MPRSVSILVDILLVFVLVYFFAFPYSLIPHESEIVVAGICLLIFLFPRDGKLKSMKDIGPVSIWKSVIASRSSLLRLFVVILATSIASLISNIPFIFENFPKNVTHQISLQNWSLNWLFVGPVLYAMAGIVSSIGCALLPSLSKKSKDNAQLDATNASEAKVSKEKHLQRWVDFSMTMFNSAFLSWLAIMSFASPGPASWISQWLIASARDANLKHMNDYTVSHINIYDWGTQVLQAESIGFEKLISAIFFAIGFLLCWRPSVALAQLLTSFVKRMFSGFSVSDALIGAWRAPAESIAIKTRHAFLKSCMATIAWLVACYLTLFAVFGLSRGPLAESIMQWMDCSVTQARIKLPEKLLRRIPVPASAMGKARINGEDMVLLSGVGKPFVGDFGEYVRGTVADNPQMRLFLASIVALYGTAPLAVTACIFLPYSNRRRLRISNEGISLPNAGLLRSPFRLWADLKSVELKGKEADLNRRTLVLKFFSGGTFSLKVNQISAESLERFLAAIDEFAQYAIISDSVLELRAQTKERLNSKGASQEQEFRSIPATSFTSTVFVPAEIGERLPSNPESNESLRVVRQLSSKPLAAVYLARKSSGGLAIVKQFHLSEDTPEAASLRKYFEREYKVLSQLSHPRIAKVLDCYSNDGESSYLVLEYFRGLDLRKFVRENGLQAEDSVRKWAKQLVELMIYLHSQDPPVLHRDLTPDNIVLAEDGQLALIDFGAAHQFLEHITGTMIGKKSYVAPEQLRGHAAVSSDIYSFACTLYFLLTGCDPVALTECCPSKKVKISPELDELITACSNFDPEKRPRSFKQILDILEGKSKLLSEAELKVAEIMAGSIEEVDPLMEKFAAICTVSDAVSQSSDNSAEVDSAQDDAAESVSISLQDPKLEILPSAPLKETE